VTATSNGVVERYFDRLVAHDFDGVAATLTDDIERVGPFGDVKSGLGEYLVFLADLMPRLPGYSMDVHRVVYSEGIGLAEITETIEIDGAKIPTPEALVFDLADDGRISKIQIYIQRLNEDVPTLAR
jgi:hypothetical protein